MNILVLDDDYLPKPVRVAGLERVFAAVAARRSSDPSQGDRA